MKIGYARLSTAEQNPDLQRDALKAAGCDKVITDKASGSTAAPPGFGEGEGTAPRRQGQAMLTL